MNANASHPLASWLCHLDGCILHHAYPTGHRPACSCGLDAAVAALSTGTPTVDADADADAEVITAAKAFLEWHRAAGKGMSRLRSPDGAVFVVVDGAHAGCLDSWYKSHFESTDHKLIIDGDA